MIMDRVDKSMDDSDHDSDRQRMRYVGVDDDQLSGEVKDRGALFIRYKRWELQARVERNLGTSDISIPNEGRRGSLHF